MASSGTEGSEQSPEGFGSDFGQFAPMSSGSGFGGDANDAFAASPAADAGAGEQASADNSEMIMGLPVMLKVVLGSAKMPVSTLSKLAKGSVVKLDKVVGDPVDILVNGRLIARGEVVVLNEGTSRFGVVLTQVGGLTPAQK